MGITTRPLFSATQNVNGAKSYYYNNSFMQHIIYWISHPTEFKLFLAIVEPQQAWNYSDININVTA